MPQRMTTLVLALLVLSFVLTLARANEQPQQIRSVDGARIFQNNCAPCHGADGRGKGPAAGTLKATMPDLTTLSQRNGGKFPVAHVRRTITFGTDKVVAAHGSTEMPIWGPIFHEIEVDQDLGNVRLENVTKYLESIQKK